MEGEGSHIIRKATLNFNLNGNYDGLQLQQEISGWAGETLIPALDSALAVFGAGEEVMVIDSLSIDIEIDSKADWKQGLEEKIFGKLAEMVRRKVGEREKKEVVFRSREQSFTDILHHYLESGRLPWNAAFSSADEFKARLNQWVGECDAAAFIDAFDGYRTPGAMARLSGLLERRSLEILVPVVTGIPAEEVKAIFRDATALTDQVIKDERKRSKVLSDFERIFLTASVTQTTVAEIVARWLRQSGLARESAFPQAGVAKFLHPEVAAAVREVQRSSSVAQQSPVAESKDQSEPERITRKHPSSEDEEKHEKELQEGIYVNNAGSVLIAPFLPALFERTGIAANGIILQPEIALALMNYCITGRAQAFEFELALPAVFCGIKPGTVAGMVAVDDASMLREAEEMLDSAIEHWSVLKDTSADGLREAFLQRNGKLVQGESEWLLIVEQKPYDMLLQQLPWNISMIKLPWMDKPLITQWV